MIPYSDIRRREDRMSCVPGKNNKRLEPLFYIIIVISIAVSIMSKSIHDISHHHQLESEFELWYGMDWIGCFRGALCDIILFWIHVQIGIKLLGKFNDIDGIVVVVVLYTCFAL